MKDRKCDRRYGAHAVCTCGHVIGSHAAGAHGSTAGGTCLHRFCRCQRFVPLCTVCKRRDATRVPAAGDVLEPVHPAMCAGCREMFKGGSHGA